MTRTALFALPLAALLIHCATSNPPEETVCPTGQQLNEDETECVPIPCEGGTLQDNQCVCPEPLVLSDGKCIDERCEGVNCDDGNECTTGECNPENRACEFENAANGTTCMTSNETGVCLNGTCVLDPCESVTCDDGNDCTEDGVCDELTGECPEKTNVPINTECDGVDVCDGEGNCVECTQSGAQCDDDNVCTSDICSDFSCDNPPGNGGGACDLDPGPGVGQCVDGSCQELPDVCEGFDCDTGNECTQGVCRDLDGAPDCLVSNQENGTPCNGQLGLCASGVCVAKCDGVDCSSEKECIEDGTCEPTTGSCVPGENKAEGISCSEGGGNVCDGAGECVECNADGDCDDGNECTVNTCNNNACSTVVAVGSPCDGGLGVCEDSNGDGACKSLVAPFDNDSPSSPAVEEFLGGSNPADRRLEYTDQISATVGDEADWVSFELPNASNSITSVDVSFTCTFSGGTATARAVISQPGRPNELVFCGAADERVTVDNTEVQLVEIQFSGATPTSQTLLDYTFIVVN